MNDINEFIGKIIQGDCLEVMKTLPDNSVDAIVTDPPYDLTPADKRDYRRGYPHRDEDNEWSSKTRDGQKRSAGGFMGKQWDGTGIAFKVETWKEALRVLKPGGHLLSFGGTRTYHRMACAIEDAGFEIRDQIMWLYGQGFPKSLNIGKQIDKIQGNKRESIGINPNAVGRKDNKGKFQPVDSSNPNESRQSELTKGQTEWEGWGTALKPSNEPIVVARKPLSEKNVALNVLKWGVGGINIDGCKIGKDIIPAQNRGNADPHFESLHCHTPEHQGRFPANVILECICDEMREGDGIKIHTNPDCPCAMLDRQSGIGNSIQTFRGLQHCGRHGGLADIGRNIKQGTDSLRGHNDTGGASRFFYCAKSSKSERNYGTDSFINIEVYKVLCENNITKEVKLAQLLVDTETLQIKDIDESGIPNQKDTEWNTILFGKDIMEKLNKDSIYITKMETNSTMTSKILNHLTFLLTNEYILDVKELKENGGNLAENVGKSKVLITTMNEKLASVLGVKNVVLGTQLKIKLKEGSNIHPTCKPVSLMQYLVRLATPPNGIVLDPFAGSGTTGIACMKENIRFILIEKEAEYIKIANARLKPYLEQKRLIS